VPNLTERKEERKNSKTYAAVTSEFMTFLFLNGGTFTEVGEFY
jgi:hypothetical protein